MRLWYYVSTTGVARFKRKLNAFIDIEFGFGLLKCGMVCRNLKCMDNIVKVAREIGSGKMINGLICFDLISDHFFYLWL